MAFRVLTLVVLALAAGPAWTQPDIGVRGGVNVATLYGTSAPASRPRVGLVAGITGEVPLRASLSLRPELAYTQRGAAGVRPVHLGDEVTIAVDYVEVALLVGREVSARRHSESRVRVVGYAGPAIASKVQEESHGLVRFRPLDVGLAVGATVRTNTLGIDTRYTFGLTNGPWGEVRHGVFSVGTVVRLARARRDVPGGQ